MKRYLLLVLTMLCAVTGAWASVTYQVDKVYGSGFSSGYIYQGQACTIISSAAGEISSDIQLPTQLKYKYYYIVGPISTADVTAINTNKNSDAVYVDYSYATGVSASDILTNSTSFSFVGLPAGYQVPDAQTGYSAIWSATWTGNESAVTGNTTRTITIHFFTEGSATTFKNISGNPYINSYGTTMNATGTMSSEEISAYTNTMGSGCFTFTSNDPYTVDVCSITLNMSKRGANTFAELLTAAKAAMTAADASQTSICSLTVVGEMTADDMTALNTAMATNGDLASITTLNLGGATSVTQEQVNALAIPTTVTRLTIPANRIVDGALKTLIAGSSYDNLTYVFSPTSSSDRTAAAQMVPDYVWVNRAGGLDESVESEEDVRNAIYIKVASTAVLNADDLSQKKNGVTQLKSIYATGEHPWQYCDFSEATLDPGTVGEVEAAHNLGYRIILPNNVTADQMAGFAANPKKGSLAAVYSYNGTRLDIMEITDGTYSQQALTDSRIVRDGTTMINVVSGTYNGTVYNSFGENLLAAINNAQSIASITSVKVNADQNLYSGNIVFTNTNITSLDVSGLNLGYRTLNVDACTSLQTLTMEALQASNVTAKNGALTSVDLSDAIISQSVDLSDNNSLTTFTTSDDTSIGTTLNLSESGLTSFVPLGKVSGDIYLNASNSLASVDLRRVQFQNTTSKIHVDATTTEESDNSENIIATLKVENAIKVPTGFAYSTRIHPYNESMLTNNYIKEEAYVAPAYTFAKSDKLFHDKEVAADGDHFRYWYADTKENDNMEVTLGTSSSSLTQVLNDYTSQLNFSSTTYNKVKVVGPVTSSDVAQLVNLNCIALDLSEATFDTGAMTALKNALKNTSTLAVHSNTKFLCLPDGSTRDELINQKALAGLANSVYCVMSTADNATDGGIDLTSYSFQSGSLQPAVTIFLNSAAYSWTTIKSGYNNTSNKYTSNISKFKNVKIGGLINSYDLSKANMKVDENGHISRIDSYVIDGQGHVSKNEYYKEEAKNWDAEWLNGNCIVYGPFSSSFNLTEIDLRDAYFEQVNTSSNLGADYIRYYNSDMTLAALGIISTATRKVVIPQTSTVHEIPADFMNCATKIRAIMIPSNIFVIRTRAFYTIDYVWTNSGTADPEGNNTRLDNGTQYKTGENVGDKVYAMNYNTTNGKYEENTSFDYTRVCYAGTYTFGSSIKMIETAAFANTQPHVKDVYVLNTVAPECHVDAFNTVMYVGNGGYSPVITDGIITRASYINNGFWITMLHYPRQTATPNTQRYTDPSREYSIATGERDGKGAIIYFPNQSEFDRAYNQGTYGYTWNAWDTQRSNINGIESGEGLSVTEAWKAAGQTIANSLYTSNSATDKAATSFYDVTYTEIGGASSIASNQPSGLTPYYQVMRSSTQLYPQSEIDANNDANNSGELTSQDYRGWHQFVLHAYAANTILDEEPYRSYIEDNEWWTICPEFDITHSESALLFGTYTGVTTTGSTTYPYISKLQYVVRNYGTKKISLCFSNNLNTQREQFSSDESKHGATDETTGILSLDGSHEFGDNDVVMKAGVPYLIKPSFSPGAVRQFRIFKTNADLTAYKNANKETNVVAFSSVSLYNKIQASQSASGTSQMAEVKNGSYTVPVFVSEADGEGLTKEAVEMDGENNKKTFTIDGIEYNRSTEYHYTFVGTFYKSFLPHYSYFLGWDSQNSCAKFYYHDGNFSTIDKEMRWANGTGVIVPVKSTDLEGGKFKYSVTAAAGNEPAQWSLLTTFLDDSFVANSSSSPSPSRSFDMVLNAPDVKAVDNEQTGVSELETETTTGNISVYSIDGQLRGQSLRGLKKGVYVVNGKKMIVK